VVREEKPCCSIRKRISHVSFGGKGGRGERSALSEEREAYAGGPLSFYKKGGFIPIMGGEKDAYPSKGGEKKEERRVPRKTFPAQEKKDFLPSLEEGIVNLDKPKGKGSGVVLY